MKILFVSKDGSGADLALRLQLQGNEVRTKLLDDKHPDQMEGLITKIKSVSAHLSWADLVVLDDTGTGLTKQLLAWGGPVYGMGHSPKSFKWGETRFNGHEVQDTLELNRKFSHRLMRSLEIGNSLESLEFTDLSQAVQYLKDHPVAYVIKPECQDAGSEKTYVSELPDGSDGVAWLETLLMRPNADKISKIELEEKINGIEVTCSAWFNGKDWIYPININFKHKKLATGDLGFNTDEMGTVMFYDQQPVLQCKFFQQTLARLGDFLKTVDYRGQLDISCIINSEGIWPLEFTPRVGYPACYIEDELQITPWADLLYAIGSGGSIINRVRPGWAIGVVLVGEGYPFEDEAEKRMKYQPVLGLTEENLKHFHPCDLMLWQGRLAATGAYVMIATAHEQELALAQAKVYGYVIPEIHFPGKYYRTDIGNRTLDQLAQLALWGWKFNLGVINVTT